MSKQDAIIALVLTTIGTFVISWLVSYHYATGWKELEIAKWCEDFGRHRFEYGGYKYVMKCEAPVQEGRSWD